MKRIYIISTVAAVMAICSCTDLDVAPKSSSTANVIFNNPQAYEQFLARIYAGLAISGQQGPAGNPDIKGIDEGFSNYLRQYWKAQQLTTDETVIGWNDGTLPTYHLHTWTAQNEFINAMFNRIFFQVSMANEFLRETTDAKLDSRNTTETLRDAVRRYRAEARVMRALSYWHGLDMFGAIPIVTEDNAVGINVPDQASRQEVFDFIESELKAVEADLVSPRQNEYGRADQAVAWMILAKLYLNANVYTGQAKNTECITYCSKIIDAGYQLDDEYQSLFRLDNTGSEEIIFSVNFDGNRTQTYGGMTFLIHASIGGAMNPTDYGVNTGWAGLRATKNFVNLFPDETGATDGRAIFYTNGQSKEIPNTPISTFNEGYAVPKYRNLNADGDAGASLEFVDTDFPMFRLADVYLMYAEAVERGGTGGSEGNAVSYINLLRERAYGDNSGNITATDITLDFLIDERARELYWEAHRRTDLIRFGLFTDAEAANPRAIWPWKGGVAEGKETESFRNLFPLPSSQIIANPKLEQNDGY
jgi:starch-binding outer membrane protein, SusD/RagB family